MLISLTANYNDLFVNIQIEPPTQVKREAEAFAGGCTIFMGPNRLRIISNQWPDQVVKNSQKENYIFQSCTKCIRPVDPRRLSKEDIADIMHDPQYMTGPEDYEDLDWDIERAYREIKRAYGPCSYMFGFDGLAYGVREP